MKIYVACLASYNNGTLHGEWFDLDDYIDADELLDAVRKKVLITSKYPNVEVDCPKCGGDGLTFDIEDCPHCKGTGRVPSAEEFAIHDHEGFPADSVGEYTSLDTLYKLKGRMEEAYDTFGDDAEEIMDAFHHCFHPDEDQYTVATVLDAHAGYYETEKAFSEDLALETGSITEDNPYYIYIDWERVWHGRDQHDFVHRNGHFFHRHW